jgi:hypothetical protein
MRNNIKFIYKYVLKMWTGFIWFKVGITWSPQKSEPLGFKKEGVFVL